MHSFILSSVCLSHFCLFIPVIFLPCHVLFLLCSFKKPQRNLISLLSLVNVNLNNNRFFRWFSLNSHIYEFMLSGLHLIINLFNFYLDSIIPNTDLHLDRMITIAHSQRRDSRRSHGTRSTLNSDFNI